ncbi:hypothetical protein IJT10_02915 [bacterium]|nr:hypothetical protein [bacterium]
MNRFFLAVIGVCLSVTVALSGCSKKQMEEDLKTCSDNLKQIGTACELYATDHKEHYPKTIEELQPKYMATIPTCPVHDTSYVYTSQKDPDSYEVYCPGSNHIELGLENDHPIFNSTQGLVTK